MATETGRYQGTAGIDFDREQPVQSSAGMSGEDNPPEWRALSLTNQMYT
jgi:hypothetical protein